MPAPIYLSLVFHNHQPVGQFDDVTEHSTQVSYIPIVDLLERHPSIHAGIHFTGPLLEWLIAHHPTLIDRVRRLVERGQVEMLTGGYYEPVLVALPDKDKIGQIRKLTDMVKAVFRYTATGMWLAERVWEPHLAKPIAEAGVRYVIVDDTHFEGVGFDKDKDLFGYYMTEEQGKSLAVFPTLAYLRYTIPWSPVEQLIEWLRAEADKPLPGNTPKIAFMGDDGEKFGTWPGTYEHCWGNGKYMDSLFRALEKNAEWLKTATPAELMRQYPPLGRAYLPTASYMEMGEWSLPADASYQLTTLKHQLEEQHKHDILRFLRGGIWRNFMVKYEAINQMHKRALTVSAKVHDMRHGRKRDQALALLWAAQSNDPYWHGVFGGVYLFNFRVANYANLIAAEALAEGDNPPLKLESRDFDADGRPELLLSGDLYNAIWTPAVGGALVEFDYRPGKYNLLNIMSRHQEAYHTDLIEAARENRVVTPDSPVSAEMENIHSKTIRAKESGLEKYLIYDWHRRASFVDHFLGPNTSLDEFYRAQYAEQGDFVNQPYRAEMTATDEDVSIHLVRDGHAWIGDVHHPVRVIKTFTVRRRDGTFRVQYTLSNPSDMAIEGRFGVETAVGFDGGQDLHYCALRIGDNPERLSLNVVAAVDLVTRYAADSNIRNLTLTTDLSRPATLWRFPLETIALSEAGFERGYQGTVFLQIWNVQMHAGGSWSVTIAQRVTEDASRP
ncbi:MAG: alpha-amylase/4-alpha-glucanotransferase domain-containing protein [Aggregatilineales bacterium]